MKKGCWKVDDDEKGPRQKNRDIIERESKGRKAVYIDLEEEEEDENKVYSRWNELPDLLLEEIFSYLSIREKYYASLVCKSWYRGFNLPLAWSDFVLCDSTLTRGRYNYYSGWQYVLDHVRTQLCLTHVGRNFRKLTFEPMLNFFNLYEFMNMLSWFSERHQVFNEYDYDVHGVGGKIKTLKFTFPCSMDNNDDTERIKLFGTGGKLLGALKRLMSNLKELKTLELIDLMLDPKEAQYLLDEVCERCCTTLKTLILINTTKLQYQLLHVGVFLNLQILKISPQNLGEDLVDLLGYTKLRHLHIIQNRYTPHEMLINPVSGRTWKTCRENNPNLSVHLLLQCPKDKRIVWQEHAPVKSIIYESPHIGIQNDSLMSAIELYRTDLKIYGHKCLPRVHKSAKFHDRIDGSLMLLCRQIVKLETLIITERMSTATILLMVRIAMNLKNLHVRRNAVMKKCDWPQSPEWSDDFYKWLKLNSKSYDFVEREVSDILGIKWHMLSDKEFKVLDVNLYR